MWTAKNRRRYDRSALRYPSDLTDDEWGLVEPLIAPARRGGNKRHVDVREVMNGVMSFLSGQNLNKFSWLSVEALSHCGCVVESACGKGIFSNRVTERICSKV